MAEEPHIDKPGDGSGASPEAPSQTTAPWRERGSAWARKAARAVGALGGEAVTLALGLALLGAFMANTLLTRQTTSLDTFRPTVKRLVAQSFDGADATFETLNMRWFPSRDSLVFTAEGVEIVDSDGQVVQRLERLRAGLVPQPGLALGSRMRPDLRDVEVVGGDVTWLQDEDGNVRAGLGTPDTVGAFGPVYRGVRDTGPSEGPDWLEGFRDLSIRDSRVHIVNRQNGLDLTFAVDELIGQRDGEAVSLQFEGRALPRTGNESAGAVEVSLVSDDALQTFVLDTEINDMRLDRVAPEQGRFAVLSGIGVPIDSELGGIFSVRDGLRAARVNLRTGSGQVTIAGQARGVRSVAFDATLDPGEQVMTVSRLAVDAQRLSLDGRGVLRQLGRISDGDVGTSPQFDLAFSRAYADLTPTFTEPLELTEVNAVGELDLDGRRLDLASLSFRPGDYGLTLSGTVATAPSGLAQVSLDGEMDGTMGAQDLLAIWPAAFADGARRWIERSILGGRIDRLSFQTDLDEAFFADPRLTPERLRLDFGVSDGTVRYISTMTPLTGAVAAGGVSGNSLSLQLASGRIGNVDITSGDVRIPQLMPKGGDIIIEAQGNGRTQDLLAIINEPPFGYLDKYGITPDGFGGTGDVTLTVRRPLLEFFDRERIEYDIKGAFRDAFAPFQLGGYGISNATVKLEGGKEGLFLNGVADLGPWQAAVGWEERYGRDGQPTIYTAEGPMDAATLDAFGLGLRRFLGGTPTVSVRATGQGTTIGESRISVDLTDTEMSFGEAWSKDKGVGATLDAVIDRSSGAFDVPSLNLAAPGLDVVGAVSLRNDFALQSARLDTLRVEGLVSGAGRVARSGTGDAVVFDADISGDFLDISDIVMRGLRQDAEPLGLPLALNAEFDTARFAPGYDLSDTVLSLRHSGEAVRNLVVGGSRPEGPVTVSIVEDGARREAVVRLPDISRVLASVYGVESLRGGALSMDATLPPAGQPGAIIGTAEVEDFTVVDAPFLAQLLSLGSLTGLLDTLGGSGLAFDQLSSDFALREGQLSLRDARMSGPALGMTAEGDVDLSGRQLDVEGALVPAYAANSLLSDIPLIGDIFTDKDGEGVFALTYTMQGPYESVQVAINPLSALTPGFLRGIFRSDREDLPDAELAEQISAVRPEPADD